MIHNIASDSRGNHDEKYLNEADYFETGGCNEKYEKSSL